MNPYEPTYPLHLKLSASEWAALRKFRDDDAKGLAGAEVARLLLRDHLIGLGLLPLGRANRGRGNWRTK